MSFNQISEDEAAEAAKEYADRLHEIYKHECYGTKKKECKLSSVAWIFRSSSEKKDM